MKGCGVEEASAGMRSTRFMFLTGPPDWVEAAVQLLSSLCLAAGWLASLAVLGCVVWAAAWCGQQGRRGFALKTEGFIMAGETCGE